MFVLSGLVVLHVYSNLLVIGVYYDEVFLNFFLFIVSQGVVNWMF